MYLVGFFLALIATFWLIRIRRKALGGRFDVVIGIFIIIGVLVPTIQAIPTMQQYVNENPQVFQNSTVNTVLILLIIFIIMIFYIIFTYRVIKSMIILVAKFREKFNANIVLEKSKPYVGGYLVFEAKFNSWLNHGYILIRIKSQFGENDDIFLRYDENKKLGNLQGRYNDYTLNYKWKIPSNFSDGEYTIAIMLYDVDDLFWLWKNKSRSKIINHKIAITEPPKKTVEIQKVMKPSIKTINGIDLSSKPISGWICIKVYNDTDINHNGCYGQVVTDINQFTLYDYEEFLKNGKTPDIDAYNSFLLEHNATKRLYANIESTKNSIKILIDIGKEEIEKELPLNFDS